MKKITIKTNELRENSGTKTWIAIIGEDNKIKEFLGIIMREKGDRWVEYSGELEEGTLLKICYGGSYSGKNKDYYIFKVGDNIKEDLQDIIQYT